MVHTVMHSRLALVPTVKLAAHADAADHPRAEMRECYRIFRNVFDGIRLFYNISTVYKVKAYSYLKGIIVLEIFKRYSLFVLFNDLARTAIPYGWILPQPSIGAAVDLDVLIINGSNAVLLLTSDALSIGSNRLTLRDPSPPPIKLILIFS